MSENSVLLIDDDRFLHKVVRRAVEPSGFDLTCASDGEEGLEKAFDIVPEVILLDVEMPGYSGYEVCTQLRQNPITEEVPVIFLSSHTTLRERMQGYEVGADDYLTKPFESEHLVARLKVLSRYRRDRIELHDQYRVAQETAINAIAGTSEFALVVQHLERILGLQSFAETVESLLETLARLNLDAVVLLKSSNGDEWFASDGTISPLEKELTLSATEQRFLDFGCRTLVNFDPMFMLVRNMPLDDMERYGRVKDLLPVLISATSSKMASLRTQEALVSQGSDLKQSFSIIRRNLYNLARGMVENRHKSLALGDTIVHRLMMDMLSMGLEEDQENYIVGRVENAFEEMVTAMDAGPMLRDSLSFILQNLQTSLAQQERLLAEFLAAQTHLAEDNSDSGDDSIELF